MPLSLRLPSRLTEPEPAAAARSMEEGDLRLGRSRFNATVKLRQLLHGPERRRKPEREISAGPSTGSLNDVELQDLQDQLEERPAAGRRADKFGSLWRPQELETSLKQMLRLAGSSLRVLEAMKQGDSERLTALCTGDELSLVEEEVAMLAGCLFGRPKLVKKLLKKGVSVSASDPEGRSALHLAAFCGQLEAVRALIKHGANVNAWDGRQATTPLICAAAASQPDVVALLLASGADVNAGFDPSDETALHYAVRANSFECVELLLKAGGRTGSASPRGETPLHVAADYGFDRCLGLLLNHGAQPDVASGSGCKTPLHLAAEDGSVRCARLLHEFGAGIDLKTSRGQTALHLAAKAQSAELIELLLAWGADINARDNELRTPLHCCIGKQCRSLDPIKILINHGALINEGDAAGYTPIHLAAINEFSSCVELLMDHGGDVTLRNKGGIGCLQLIKHRTPSVLANLPDRFSRAILFYERDGLLNNKYAELKINFKPLMSQAKGECHLLKALIDVDQKHLLKHPLCESFLHMKWMKVRQFLFYNLFHYLLFCILLSLYVLGTCHGDCYNMGEALHASQCSGFQLNELAILTERCKVKGRAINLKCRANETHVPAEADLCECVKSSFQLLAVMRPSFYAGLWYFLLVFEVTLVFKELFQLVQDPPQYFRNPENLAEWALMFFLFLIGVPLMGHVAGWQKHLGALSVLICWFELMMLVGRFPRLGLYIHMFSKVLNDFFQFLLAYCSLGIGCALAFVVLFPRYAPLSDPLRSALKVLVMMTGELEFDDMFYGENVQGTILNPTASLVFAAFLFLMTIILMNLLVGLAVSDIQGLQRTAKLGRLVHLTDQIAHIERTLFSKVMTRLLPEKVCSWIAGMALVSPSSYRYTLVLRPNDPNDTRLTREIMNSACRVAKIHAKETLRNSKLRRQMSSVDYDYELIQSLQDGEKDDAAPAGDATVRDGKLQALKTQMETTQSALAVLLGEVRNIAKALNALSESHGLPRVPVPRTPLSVTVEEPADGPDLGPDDGPPHSAATPTTSLESDA